MEEPSSAARSCTSATLWRSASIRSIDRRLGDRLRRDDLLARELRLEHPREVAAVVVLEVLRRPLSGEARDDLLGELRAPRRAPRSPPTASSISSFERTSSAKKSVSSASPPFCGADQAEVLLAPEHELADRGHARLLHRAQQQHVRPALRVGVRGREVVGAVEVDGVDVLEPDEAQDLDRLRALERDRLEIGLLDEHVLALRELPALDELVRLDVALVHRAPALLLDRRAALAMERAEGHVAAAGSRGRARRGC